MSSSAPNPLWRVASSTFEELGFLFPDAELSAAQAGAESRDAVTVEFDGPVQGALVLRLYGEVLPALAMNMLGESEPPAAELQRDALGEVANVICGNVLPSLAGAQAVFRLAAPRPAAAADGSGGPPAWRAVLGLETGRAEVDLYARTAA